MKTVIVTLMALFVVFANQPKKYISIEHIGISDKPIFEFTINEKTPLPQVVFGCRKPPGLWSACR